MTKIDELKNKINELKTSLKDVAGQLSNIENKKLSVGNVDVILKVLTSINEELDKMGSSDDLKSFESTVNSATQATDKLTSGFQNLLTVREQIARKGLEKFALSKDLDLEAANVQRSIDRISKSIAESGLTSRNISMGGKRAGFSRYYAQNIEPQLTEIDPFPKDLNKFEELNEYFKDIEQSSGISTESVQKFIEKLSTLQSISKQESRAAIENLSAIADVFDEGSADLDKFSSKVAQLTNLTDKLNLMVLDEKGFSAKNLEEDKKPIPIGVTGDWVRGLKEFEQYGGNVAETGELLPNILRSLSQIVGEHKTLLDLSKGLKISIDGTNQGLQVQYTEIKKIGDASITLPKKTALLSYTGEKTNVGTMPTPQVFSSTAGVDYVKQNADYVKKLYANVYSEINKAQERLASDTDVLTSDKPKVRINEITGEVEILINYVQKLSDETSRAGKEFIQLRAAQPGVDPTLEQPRSRIEGIKDLFGNGEAATTFTRNLNAALENTNLTVEDITSAYKEQSSQITRINLATKDLEGNTTKLSLAFDKNGQQVADNSSRFSHFNDAIGQVITRLIRYSIAANLVYTAFNKIQEIPTIIGDVGDAIARLGNLTNLGAEAASKYYEDALAFADKYKLDITDTLQSSKQIFQYTGGNDTEEALELLSSSMILAKISGEDLSSSIDILVSVMNQFDMSAEDSSLMLAKWYDISKRVGTSVNAIAESFAIAGSIAKESGIGEDLLTAITATMVEATPLTAREVANLQRTIFSNLTSPEALTQLEKYGIEVKDAITGQYKDAETILEQLYLKMYKYQTLPETAALDIARAIGGGSRQGPRVLTYIQQYEKAIGESQLVSQVQDTEGLTQMMSDITKSLKSDLIDLNNSFVDLAKAVGDAGLEEILRNMIELLTDIVDVTKEFIDGMSSGQMAGIISTLALVGLNFKSLTSGIKDASKESNLLYSILGKFKYFQTTATVREGGWRAPREETVTDTAKINSLTESAGMSVGYAAANAFSTYIGTGDLGMAAASGFGSAVTGIIGAQLGGSTGALIGAQVGSFIATTIMQQVQEDTEETKFLEPYKATIAAGGQLSTKDIEEIFAELQPQTKSDIENISRKLVGAGAIGGASGSAGEGVWSRGKGSFATPNVLGEAGEEVNAILLETLNNEKAIAEEIQRQEQEQELLNDATLERVAILKEQLFPTEENPQSAGLIERLKRQAFERRLSGEEGFGAAKYEDYIEALGTDALTKSVDLVDILGNEYEDNFSIFEKYLPIIADTDEELRAFLGSTIRVAQESKTAWLQGSVSAQEYEQNVEDVKDVLDLLEQKFQERTLSRLELVSPIDVRDTSAEQRSYAERFARKYQKSLAQQSGFTEEEYQQFVDSLPPVTLRIDNFEFEQVEGIKQELYQLGLEWGQEVNSGMENAFNIRRLSELGPEDIPELERRSAYWTNYLARARGYGSAQEYQQAVPEDFQDFNLVLGENNVLYKMLSTNEAMNFTLQDILETEKKQLEGMWNIPEGATFWVPLTSAFYGGGEGGMELPDLPAAQPLETPQLVEDILGPEDDLDDSAIKLNSAGDKLSRAAEMQMRAHTFSQVILKAAKKPAETQAEYYQSISPLTKRMYPGETLSGHFNALDYYSRQNSLESQGTDSVRKMTDIGSIARDAVSGAGRGNITVNVPEPKSFSVENRLDLRVQINQTTLARTIRSILSRELSRQSRKRSYTVPYGAR